MRADRLLRPIDRAGVRFVAEAGRGRGPHQAFGEQLIAEPTPLPTPAFVVTTQTNAEVAGSGNPMGLPVHPLLIAFWAMLVFLLIGILLRQLRQ
ncbi:MAG: hypothetical protein H0V51_14035 [Chloroflexi bacterium]|nr:hypothetical protein [Chloroflexota bacterium]